MTASPDPVDIVEQAVLARYAEPRPRHMLVIGICGPQGSGKSTLTGQLEERMGAQGLRVATLSLDDLYLPHQARKVLAETVHPLLATRGVPGTHDVALGIATLDALDRGEPTALPRFNKGADSPIPQEEWPVIGNGVDVLLFEGWCVGARPGEEAALAEPVNALERDDDADGRWRRGVNEALAGPYQTLFGRIDFQILLAIPDFGWVRDWRVEQEHTSRRLLTAAQRPQDKLMSDEQIARFIQFYQRLTMHAVAEMRGRADLVLDLGSRREVLSVTAN